MKHTTHTTVEVQHDGPLRTLVLDYGEHIDASRSIGKLSDEQAEVLAKIVLGRIAPRGPLILARVVQAGAELLAESLKEPES